MRDDVRYNVELRDSATGEVLGLILTDPGDVLGYRRALSNPYAAKAASGDTAYHDLTDWSMAVFADWTAGRGYEEEGVAGGYLDAHGVETRIARQLTLGPLAQVATASDPEYVPGSVTEYVLGYVREIAGHDEEDDFTIGFTQKIGERFIVPSAGELWARRIKFKLKKSGGGHTGNVKACIYTDVDGLPGSEVVCVEADHSTIGTSFAVETYTFSAPESLTPGAYYWAVFDAQNAGMYTFRQSTPGTYVDGYAAWDMGGWRDESPMDLWFEVVWARVQRAQSFTTPGGGMDCDEVRLWLRKVGTPSTITVGLYADSDGSPTGSALKSATITAEQVDTVGGWVPVTWVAEALDGGTKYHIALSTPDSADDAETYYVWGGDSEAGYAAGKSHIKLAAGAWTEETPDLYFRAFDSSGRAGVVLEGHPVAFARFNGAWYCAGGDTVYEWDAGTGQWDTSEASAGNDVTSLEVWDGFLWAARGTATNVRKLNTSAEWGDAGWEAGLLFRGGSIGGGWLHIQDADNEHQFRYTADGSTLSDPFEVGSLDYPITGFAWFRDMLVIATTVALFGFAAETVYQVLDWRGMEHADNGKALYAWGRDGALYIPLLFGLYRWNGDTMRAVGPEQGPVGEEGSPGGTWINIGGLIIWLVPPPEGLPGARAGAVLGLWGTNNWLYAVIEGGAAHTSSVMATDGIRGWHEVVRAEYTTDAILSVGYETLSSPACLWYGLGLETRFVELPDYSDNPYLWPGLTFRGSGEIITPWVGTDLQEVVKDWHQVIVKGEAFSSGQAVEVWYEVDRSDRWLKLGEIQEAPRQALAFRAMGFQTKTVGSGSTKTTIELGSGDTSDMAAGYWVRINAEVAQVASITDTDTFVLETALSEAPSAGDYVYASRPAGRELRLKLILKTDDAALTPKVDAVLLQYQPNVQDRWTWALNVKCADRLKDLCGGYMEKTAAELRAELARWATRVTPFSLVDLDGDTWTVKVSAATERAVQAQRVGDAGQVYDSVWDLVLLQVG